MNGEWPLSLYILLSLYIPLSVTKTPFVDLLITWLIIHTQRWCGDYRVEHFELYTQQYEFVCSWDLVTQLRRQRSDRLAPTLDCVTHVRLGFEHMRLWYPFLVGSRGTFIFLDWYIGQSLSCNDLSTSVLIPFPCGVVEYWYKGGLSLACNGLAPVPNSWVPSNSGRSTVLWLVNTRLDTARQGNSVRG